LAGTGSNWQEEELYNMKVLIVCSGNAGYISPFILDQAEALEKPGISFEYFSVKERGILGYLRNIPRLIRSIKELKPDLIHAHYGLSGLLANFQREIPVVTTFHGSDVNYRHIRPLSIIASRLSIHSIYISRFLAVKAHAKNNYSIIPCGFDPDVFFPIDKVKARKLLQLPLNMNLVLFASSFQEKVKNYPLARKAVEKLDNVKLIQLKGYPREEVNLLMNGCDVALMTSFSEGSPQFIKEAMACNTPIVTVDVGDVADRLGGKEGCFICERDPEVIAENISKAIAFGQKTACRTSVMKLNNELIAQQIFEVYRHAIQQKDDAYFDKEVKKQIL
jgi:teichuronic acid biosynthesis glycosyltransferase TuaC